MSDDGLRLQECGCRYHETSGLTTSYCGPHLYAKVKALARELPPNFQRTLARQLMKPLRIGIKH